MGNHEHNDLLAPTRSSDKRGSEKEHKEDGNMAQVLLQMLKDQTRGQSSRLEELRPQAPLFAPYEMRTKNTFLDICPSAGSSSPNRSRSSCQHYSQY